jgi:Transposase DDE domain
MYSDLDTLITALYVTIDDLFKDLGLRRGPGRPPECTDAELICIAVAQVLLRCNWERRWMRFVRQRLGQHFPAMPQQAGYNKRLRAAGPLLAVTMAALAGNAPSLDDHVRLVDSTPVPCGASRQTALRSQLRGSANYGYCAAHSRWFWGLRLYLITAPDGMPMLWCLADPKLGEREVTQALLDDVPIAGMLIIGDKGFAGRDFEHFIDSLHATLYRPDREDEPRRHGSLGWIRQRIESVFWTLKDQLGLEEHGARTQCGVFARIAQRLLALTAAIWHNWNTHAPNKRSLIAYDH